MIWHTRREVPFPRFKSTCFFSTRRFLCLMLSFSHDTETALFHWRQKQTITDETHSQHIPKYQILLHAAWPVWVCVQSWRLCYRTFAVCIMQRKQMIFFPLCQSYIQWIWPMNHECHRWFFSASSICASLWCKRWLHGLYVESCAVFWTAGKMLGWLTWVSVFPIFSLSGVCTISGCACSYCIALGWWLILYVLYEEGACYVACTDSNPILRQMLQEGGIARIARDTPDTHSYRPSPGVMDPHSGQQKRRRRNKGAYQRRECTAILIRRAGQTKDHTFKGDVCLDLWTTMTTAT